MRQISRTPLGRAAATVLGAAGLLLASTATAGAAESAGALWHFDELAGATATDSLNANHGVLRGGVVVGAAGAVNTAYDFRAKGSWVEVPTSDTLNPGTRNFSYSASVYLDRVPTSGVTYDIIRKGLATTAGGEFKLEIVKNGYVRCIAKDSNRLTGSITGPKINLADGRWHRVGCERVGTSWRVIVDGRTRSKTVAFGSIGNTKSLSIGSKYGQEDGTPGLVDEVSLTIS